MPDKVKCVTCGCVYTFDASDVHEGGWPSYVGQYVECPICGQKHFLR